LFLVLNNQKRDGPQMPRKRPSVQATDTRDRDIGQRVRVQRLAKGMSQKR
jgi:hypothetical protein